MRHLLGDHFLSLVTLRLETTAGYDVFLGVFKEDTHLLHGERLTIYAMKKMTILVIYRPEIIPFNARITWLGYFSNGTWRAGVVFAFYHEEVPQSSLLIQEEEAGGTSFQHRKRRLRRDLLYFCNTERLRTLTCP